MALADIAKYYFVTMCVENLKNKRKKEYVLVRHSNWKRKYTQKKVFTEFTSMYKRKELNLE